jgi:hypothetical protein
MALSTRVRRRHGQIDLFRPSGTTPLAARHVPAANRKILHFAKTARLRKFCISPEIEICADVADLAG